MLSDLKLKQSKTDLRHSEMVIDQLAKQTFIGNKAPKSCGIGIPRTNTDFINTKHVHLEVVATHSP